MNRPALLQIYAFDERYSVPHWRTIDAEPAQASAVAREVLAAHSHYLQVEIWLENQQVARVHRDGDSAAL